MILLHCNIILAPMLRGAQEFTIPHGVCEPTIGARELGERERERERERGGGRERERGEREMVGGREREEELLLRIFSSGHRA